MDEQVAEREAEPTRRSKAEQLVDLAQRECELVRDSLDRAFAYVRLGGKGRTLIGVRSPVFKRLLYRWYRHEYGTVPSPHSVSAAIEALDAETVGSKVATLNTRVAGDRGGVQLDLGDNAGRQVEVTGNGWRTVEAGTTPFRRKAIARSLPEPVRGGTLQRLGYFLNVSGDDLKLVVSWLLGALHPSGP